MNQSFLLQLTKWGRGISLAAGAAGLLWAGAAQGEDPDAVFRQAAYRLTAYQEGTAGESSTMPYDPKLEPQNQPEPAEAAADAPDPGPWTLTELFADEGGGNFLKDHNIRLYGNLVQSFTFNFQGPRDKFNGPVTWTDRSNEYQMNQFWLGMEKATDTSNQDWDWGGRIDMNYGTSSRFMTQSGFEPHNFYNQDFYGLAFPNAYLQFAYQKLNVKVGRFVSPIGYFTINTVDNFFNTIPYTYQWGEMFTNTGIWATYQVSDNFTVSAALIRGWDNFDNSNPSLGWMGTAGYTFADKSNLTFVNYWSREPNINFNFSQRYYQSLVYSKPINDQWNYVGETDLGAQQDAMADGRTAYWYGINQYLYYTVSDRLTFGINFEWWRDEEGFRVAGFLPSNLPSGITSDARGWSPAHYGYQGNFYQVTMGPKWYPTDSKNLFVRPNFRVDWFQGDSNNADGLKPFDDGGKNYQTLFVTDLCILF